MKRHARHAAILMATALVAIAAAPAAAQQRKPNILVIFGDDVGQSNISAYTHGLVGYKTPNIDRIAREGMMFTDYYAENSCTAGRSTFITRQTIWRTGMSKVGLPGAPVGIQDRDITIAQALKPLGYATGQFGKNHLGDQDRFLPTAHGFDEFFGNLYHLNAEEEPERPYWPTDDPAFKKGYNPRGVLHATADGKIEDTGPLNRKADGDDRRRDREGGHRLHDAPGEGEHVLLHVDELHPHAHLHARQARVHRQGGPRTRLRLRGRHVGNGSERR